MQPRHPNFKMRTKITHLIIWISSFSLSSTHFFICLLLLLLFICKNAQNHLLTVICKHMLAWLQRHTRTRSLSFAFNPLLSLWVVMSNCELQKNNFVYQQASGTSQEDDEEACLHKALTWLNTHYSTAQWSITFGQL